MVREYGLIYCAMDSDARPGDCRVRARDYDINVLINLADLEQHEYNSCHIEYNGQVVWEPSLGRKYTIWTK